MSSVNPGIKASSGYGGSPSVLTSQSIHEEGSAQKRLHPPHRRWRNIRLVGRRGKTRGSWKPPCLALFLRSKEAHRAPPRHVLGGLARPQGSLALVLKFSQCQPHSGYQLSLLYLISQAVQNIKNERGAGRQVLPNPNKKIIQRRNENQRKAIGSVPYGEAPAGHGSFGLRAAASPFSA